MQTSAPHTKSSNPPVLLTTKKEVARVLSVSDRQVGYWQEEGRIPFHKFGKRCVRYNLAEVLKALGVQNDVDGGAQ